MKNENSFFGLPYSMISMRGSSFPVRFWSNYLKESCWPVPSFTFCIQHCQAHKLGLFFARFQKTQGRLQKSSTRFLAKNSRLWRQLWISRKKLNSFRQKPPEFFQKFYEFSFILRNFPKIWAIYLEFFLNIEFSKIF